MRLIRAWILLTIFTIYQVSGLCDLPQEYRPIIQKYLEPFKQGITKDMVISDKGQAYHAYTAVIEIKDGKWMNHTSMVSFYKKFLDDIAKELPDMIFALNWGDQPRVQKGQCKQYQLWRKCACDPKWKQPQGSSFFDSNYQSQGRQSVRNKPLFSAVPLPECFLDIPFPAINHVLTDDSLKGQLPSWQEKRFKAIWRGSPTGRLWGWQSLKHCQEFLRCKFMTKCKEIPDCDGRFSLLSGCDEKLCAQMREFFGKEQRLDINEFRKYKIVVDLDGNTYSGRLLYLLGQEVAVYRASAINDLASLLIKPWVHYVPLRLDMSDLQVKIRWGKNNDQQLRKIAKRGYERYKQLFTYDKLKCYAIHLLLEYKKLWRD